MNSKRKCASCGKYFKPNERQSNNVSVFCSRDCVLDKANSAKPKSAMSAELLSARKGRKEKFIKSALSPRPRSLRAERRLTESAARILCHQLDMGKPCISCGKTQSPGEAFHAGHYRSVGAHPELSCDLTNIHLQCAECNTAKSGNIAGYREGLADRYGTKYAEWIDLVETPNGVNGCEWYKAMRAMMVADIKRLKKGEPAQIDWREGPPQ